MRESAQEHLHAPGVRVDHALSHTRVLGPSPDTTWGGMMVVMIDIDGSDGDDGNGSDDVSDGDDGDDDSDDGDDGSDDDGDCSDDDSVDV